jgi:hypothetical protein
MIQKNRFSLKLTTQRDKRKNDMSSHYYSGQFFVSGTYVSADIRLNSTAFEFKRIIENMPNVAEVQVKLFSGANFVTWQVTFMEAFDVPLFEIYSSNLICSYVNQYPIIVYDQHAQFDGSPSYGWDVVLVSSSEHPNYYIIRDLIPGQK